MKKPTVPPAGLDLNKFESNPDPAEEKHPLKQSDNKKDDMVAYQVLSVLINASPATCLACTDKQGLVVGEMTTTD